MLSILMLICLVASCTPSSGTEPKTLADQTSSEVKDKSSSPITASIVADLPEIEEKEPVSPEKDLLNKGKDINNYKVAYKSQIRTDEGLFLEQDTYTLYAKDNKFKLAYLEHRKLDPGVNYDTLYLDTEAKTAYATCENKGVVCESDKWKAFELDYNEEIVKIITPLTLLNRISTGSDIKHLKGLWYDNRKVTIVDFVNPDASLEELYIDNFYGIPLKQVIYGYDGGLKVIQEQKTFAIIDISGVKILDVTVPENYPVLG